MRSDEPRAFDEWLDRANRELVASVATRLNVEAALREVKLREGEQAASPKLPEVMVIGKQYDVSAALAGDRQAIERLLASIRPLVVRYCRARVGRQERSFASADDV